jgi:hypothetical protein
MFGCLVYLVYSHFFLGLVTLPSVTRYHKQLVGTSAVVVVVEDVLAGELSR